MHYRGPGDQKAAIGASGGKISSVPYGVSRHRHRAGRHLLRRQIGVDTPERVQRPHGRCQQREPLLHTIVQV